MAERLTSFSERRPSRLRTVGAGYTMFVRIIRFALPVVALILIGVVAAQLSFNQNDQQKITQVPETEKAKAGESEITAAKYESRDAQGRKYSLTADQAARVIDQTEAVSLTRPAGLIELGDDQTLQATAVSGLFDNAAQKLSLSGGVSLNYAEYYQLSVPELHVDLQDHSATGIGAVTMTAPEATITATGLSTSAQGDIVTLTGPIKGRLGVPPSLPQEKTP